MLQVHCEEPSIIDPLVTDALAAGDVSCRHHALTRPAHAEAAATRKAIEMARRADAPLYIVHLSCAEALEAVAEAKSRGEPVYAETCPHYLSLTDALYTDPDEAEVIKRVISPPLRTADDVEALWSGLRDGILDVVGSDHVPDRLDTEKLLPAPPFPEISNGGPGIETLLRIVYSAGVGSGRMGIERLVEVLSTTPARLFGLPSKGAIEAGRDADLVLFDPEARGEIRQADLAHTSDYTPYEGMPVVGEVRDVLVRGRRPEAGLGRFIERRLAG
jgi:dihydropyrimidinase